MPVYGKRQKQAKFIESGDGMGSDRRVKYTKMVLRESLIKLMHDRPVSRITIKELCEDADVNRATFYSHYTDQFDLLKKIQAEFIADIDSYLDKFTPEVGETSMLKTLTKILEYIDRNKELCRVLLGRNGDIDFQTNVMQVLSKRIVLEWRKKQKIDESTAEYIYSYVATGSIGVIRKWLFDENPKPLEKMAELVARLTSKGIEPYLM
jgi:AcrR family transcriptional regulator